MKALVGIRVITAACVLAASHASDPRDLLDSNRIDIVRVNLNPWGAHLGFEKEIVGDDPRLEPLVGLIRGAAPGGGHKCANAGTIRFRMQDGSVFGVGLLPSHTAGLYELRLYDEDLYIEAFRVDRAALLTVLSDLGVPIEDPAFRE